MDVLKLILAVLGGIAFASFSIGVGIYQIRTGERLVAPNIPPKDAGAKSTGIALIIGGIGMLLIGFGAPLYFHYFVEPIEPPAFDGPNR